MRSGRLGMDLDCLGFMQGASEYGSAGRPLSSRVVIVASHFSLRSFMLA